MATKNLVYLRQPNLKEAGHRYLKDHENFQHVVIEEIQQHMDKDPNAHLFICSHQTTGQHAPKITDLGSIHELAHMPLPHLFKKVAAFDSIV